MKLISHKNHEKWQKMVKNHYENYFLLLFEQSPFTQPTIELQK
jgi:hypothetical protein